MELTCKSCGCIDQPEVRQNGPHKSAYCKHCNAWMKHVSQQPEDDFVFYYGKYKGRNVKSMIDDKEARSWLVYAYNTHDTLKEYQRNIIKNLIHV